MSNISEPKVVTFYSFKGGVGRTLALANMAFEAYITDKKVFIIDNDLESPGVSYKLASSKTGIREMKKDSERKKFTMADVFFYFTDRIVKNAHENTKEEWRVQGDTPDKLNEFWFGSGTTLSKTALAKINEEIFKGDSDLPKEEQFTIENCIHAFEEVHIVDGIGLGSSPKNGWIKYITAGSLGNYLQYWYTLSSLDWTEENNYNELDPNYHPLLTVHCIDWLIDCIKNKYNPDYIFIDSRSGFASLSKRVCVTLSDQVFLLSSNLPESFQGLFHMYYEIFKYDAINKRNTNVKFVYSRVIVDNDDTLAKKTINKLEKGYLDVVEDIEYENNSLFGGLEFLIDDEKKIFDQFKKINPPKDALIIRHSDQLLREEKIVLSEVTYDEPLARDMLTLFQNIIGFGIESMFLGIEYFVKFPGLYFEIFKNHAIDNPTEENYFYLLRFYGNMKLSKNIMFYEIVEKYFSYFELKPDEINEGTIDLFLLALENRNMGNDYNYTISNNNELTKITDILTNIESRYDLRRRWLTLKIYSEDYDVRSSGMRKLEECIHDYIFYDSDISGDDKNAYIIDYLKAIARYGKASGFTGGRFKDIRSYCEKNFEELRVPYYLAEFKIISDDGDLNELLNDRNKLSILIKDSTHSLGALLSAFSGDRVSNDILNNFIIFLNKMFEEGLISEEEKIEIRKVFFNERADRMKESFVYKVAEYLREYVYS